MALIILGHCANIPLYQQTLRQDTAYQSRSRAPPRPSASSKGKIATYKNPSNKMLNPQFIISPAVFGVPLGHNDDCANVLYFLICFCLIIAWGIPMFDHLPNKSHLSSFYFLNLFLLTLTSLDIFRLEGCSTLNVTQKNAVIR